MSTKINAKLTNWEQSISKTWRLMNYEEAEEIAKNYNAINSLSDVGVPFKNSSCYLLSHEDKIQGFKVTAQGVLNIIDSSMATATIVLRPVTTITIQ